MQGTERRKEVRIGLVLYGGVSLAVYINGATQEFFRAVRGHGIYRLLKGLIGADIVVDVISGTSAGGLNGVYLAYALCQDQPRNFLVFSDLWRETGDVSRLLRQPGSEAPNSLLDGEGYYQKKLAEAFGRLQDSTGDGQAATEPADPSTVQELDLFVTGTDYQGAVFTRFDDTGRMITVKDHHAIFQLKYRRDRSSDFNPPGFDRESLHGQLAKLCRLTSCFPVAFPPVRVDSDREDPLLWRWGQLIRRPLPPGGPAGQRHYFLDGGVLDNKPFSYTVDAIFRRTSERLVTRKLFYVEPAIEVFDVNAVPEQPNVLQAALGALTEIPSYESIASDLESIRERNKRIEQFGNILKTLNGASDDPSPEQVGLYQRSRLNVLLDRVLEGILRDQNREVLRSPEEQRLAGRLFEGFFQSFAGPRLPEVILSEFDVYFRMRRLFHVTYRLFGSGSLTRPDEEALYIANRWIKCLEVIQFAMESLVDEAHIAWLEPDAAGGRRNRAVQHIWEDTAQALRYVIQADEEVQEKLHSTPERQGLTDLLGLLQGRIRKVAGDPGHPRPTAPTGLLQFLDQKFEDGNFLGGSALALQAWEEFPRLDVYRYPLQAASGMFELDQIDTVRVSPNDAQLGFCRRSAEDKLSGDQFFHFSGFFKRSWRSNDIMWGRLDGMCRIFEALLTPEALVTPADPAAHESLIRSFGMAADLEQWVRDLNSADSVKRTKARAELDLKTRGNKGGKFDQLVRFGQGELLEAGVGAVIADSIGEQLEWNNCKVDDSGQVAFNIEKRLFTHPTSGFISIAAEQMAKNALDRATAEKLLDGNNYTVGSESLTADVPKPVLAEIASRAAMVLRDCLVPQLEAQHLAVTKSRAYRYAFDWPLRLIHGFAQLVREAPVSARVVTWVLLLYSVAALVVGIKWRSTFINPSPQGFQILPFLLLIAGPAVFLLLLPELLDWEYPRGKARWQRYAPGGALFLSLALALGVVWKIATLRGVIEGAVTSRAHDIANVGLIVALGVIAVICVWLFRLVRKGFSDDGLNLRKRRQRSRCHKCACPPSTIQSEEKRPATGERGIRVWNRLFSRGASKLQKAGSTPLQSSTENKGSPRSPRE
jgi:predicted acylesterase/phospholipase RssA